MSGSIAIRPLQEADVEGVVDLYNRGGFGPIAGGQALTGATFRRLLEERGTYLFLVAESQEPNAIVGTLGLFQVSEQRVAQPEEVFAGSFFIHPEFRNGSIPNLLFIEALRALIRDGYSCISATVNPANTTALALYKRMGLYRTRASSIDYDGQIELKGYQPLIMRSIKQMVPDYLTTLPRVESCWRFLAPRQSLRSTGYDTESWNGLEVITYEIHFEEHFYRFRLDVESNGLVELQTNAVHFSFYPEAGPEGLVGEELKLVHELTTQCEQACAVSRADGSEVLTRRIFGPHQHWRYVERLVFPQPGRHVVRCTLHLESCSLDFQVGVRLLTGVHAQRVRPLVHLVPGTETVRVPICLQNATQRPCSLSVVAPSWARCDSITLAAESAAETALSCEGVPEGVHAVVFEAQAEDGTRRQLDPVMLPALRRGMAVSYREESGAYVLESTAVRATIDAKTGLMHIWDKGASRLALYEAWPDVGPPFPGGLKRGKVRRLEACCEADGTLTLQETLKDGSLLRRTLRLRDDHLLEIQQAWKPARRRQARLKTYGWCALRQSVLTVPLREGWQTRPVIYGEYPYAMHEFEAIPSADLPCESAAYAENWSVFEEAGRCTGLLWERAAEICYGLHWMPSLFFELPEKEAILPGYAYYIGPGGANEVQRHWQTCYAHGPVEAEQTAVLAMQTPETRPAIETVLERLSVQEAPAVRLTPGGTGQTRGYQVDNGVVRFQVAPKFAGSIYSLTFQGANLLQTALPRPRPFGENASWFGGIHPYRVNERTNLLESLLCDGERIPEYEVQPYQELDAQGRAWEGVILTAGALRIAYSVLPGTSMLRLMAEYHNTRAVTETFDLLFYAFFRALHSRVPKMLYYERQGKGAYLKEEKRGRRVYTGRSCVVTLGRDVAVSLCAPEIATYEWPKDGFQHALLHHFDVAPGETQRAYSYLFVSDSLEQAFSVAGFQRSQTGSVKG
ncbi:ribosomal protein S18 acetylase RimI-like enzyme [Thermosporothrix hazakensis]|jgi:ribosomal protein S18 acetylase RimI-like enzyme|uniref:Ribosomal protein S18 acetylase RimI-like enzyme n=1 Tax=Thermosporothrix hazakensis TaxID=644383 RepID=A0A326TZB2_THEHA|nr:GNAT family N-acetyltransferase [Thermosporothrix hazakensis]PZW22845.1 ribosomal protein S18 acetylase RimI-like enzyme [Thermosporothrix hazakensis]GCE49812.1 hypothetical protein KTH_46810 [Thermosporothrix hazakensis]